jgi:hypothetical protein
MGDAEMDGGGAGVLGCPFLGNRLRHARIEKVLEAPTYALTK